MAQAKIVEARIHSVEFSGKVSDIPAVTYSSGSEGILDLQEAFSGFFGNLLPYEPKALVLVLEDGREVILRHDYWGRDGVGVSIGNGSDILLIN